MKMILLLLLTLISSQAGAGIFKWVDENGNVHFGDRPASNTNAIEIDVESAVARQEQKDENIEGELTREEKRQRIIDAMKEDREEKSRLKREEKQKKKMKKMECARLRDKLKSLARAGGVYKLDKDGNRVFLNKNKRNENEKRLRKTIQKHCR